jgi:hypothetical protein
MRLVTNDFGSGEQTPYLWGFVPVTNEANFAICDKYHPLDFHMLKMKSSTAIRRTCKLLYHNIYAVIQSLYVLGLELGQESSNQDQPRAPQYSPPSRPCYSRW